MSTIIMKQYRYNYGGKNYPENGWEVEDTYVKVPLNLSANQRITKLGISAPTGSIIAIGKDNNDFVIGSFETLEFNCNGITISQLWLKPPISAVIDSNGTTQTINDGLRGMDAALTEKLNSSDCSITVNTEAEAVNVLSDEDAITVETTTVSGDDIETILTDTGGTSASIENTFLEKYTAAYNTYLSGIRGVWTTSEGATIKNILINVEIEEMEASA